MGDNSEAQGSLGGRLLIIIYALGIVLIGLHPFEVKYGGVWQYIKKEYYSFVNTNAIRRPTTGRLAQPEVKRLQWPTLGEKGQGQSRQAEPKRELDRLTHQDRNELNHLIDDLVP